VDEPTVFVDAMNVMRSRWPNLRAESLIELTHTWAEQEGVHSLIVFDGHAPAYPGGTSLLDDRTSIVGTGSGTADDWIVEQAEHMAREGRRLWLVSSDRELRRRVSPYVERSIGGGSFVKRLEALDSGPPSSADA
jgi:predicted RNA-binding protein with PIN domain